MAYLLELCGLKLVLTALCSGSGLVGGTFAPSLFLGATAGAAYQQVVLGLVANAARRARDGAALTLTSTLTSTLP